MRVVPTEIGMRSVTLAIEWQRFLATAPGESRVVEDETRTVTLEEGERHVVAVFPESEPGVGECGYKNRGLELEVDIVEDPRFEDTPLGFDLWWRHTGLDGKPELRRLETSGSQGESVPFAFEPLALARAGDPYPQVSLKGEVQARRRPDGTIDVRLEALRWLKLQERAGWAANEHGEKVFSLHPAETVGLLLPSPHVEGEPTAGMAGLLDALGYTPAQAPPELARITEELILTVTAPSRRIGISIGCGHGNRCQVRGV